MGTVTDNPPSAATSVLRSILSGIYRHNQQQGLGKIVQITAAKSGDGTSYVARNLALLASSDLAQSGQRVALIDYDTSQRAQSQYFFAPQRINGMSGPYDASYGQSGFWAAQDRQGQSREISDLCAFYLDGHTGLAVSTFLTDRMFDGETIVLRQVLEYWQNLRRHFAFVIIDSPAMDRWHEALTLAPLVDTTVLVAEAERANDPTHEMAKQAILNAGGRYEGLLLNAGAPVQLVDTA